MDIADMNPLRRRSAAELAAQELDRARRELLEAQTNCEYWMAQSRFNDERIDRLTRYLRGAE
jgi:hypothetical protein